jgi:hypothetical protein
MKNDTNKCLIYTKSDNQQKSCRTAYEYDKCRCINCKTWKSLKSANYYKNNDSVIKDNSKKWYISNIEKATIASKKWQSNNLDKVKESKNKWAQNNMDKIRAKNRRRRATKLNNGFEIYSELDVLSIYGTTCYLCNEPVDLNASRKSGKPGWEKGLHIEHVVDLALGGPDTLDNVRPAHGICNLTKKPRQMV